jgi:hypothetical protein
MWTGYAKFSARFKCFLSRFCLFKLWTHSINSFFSFHRPLLIQHPLAGAWPYSAPKRQPLRLLKQIEYEAQGCRLTWPALEMDAELLTFLSKRLVWLITFNKLSIDPDKQHARNSRASSDHTSPSVRWYRESSIAFIMSARYGRSRRASESAVLSPDESWSYCSRSRTRQK